MSSQLAEHAVQWWATLGESGQLALIFVVVGAWVVVATTWLGVRQWWRRWKTERTENR